MTGKYNKGQSYREIKQNKEESRVKRLKADVVESLKLPKDFLMGEAMITVTGNCEAYIENYRGILEYTRERIVLQTKTCRLVIEGKNLSISYYTNEEMQIVGIFERFCYQQ